MNSDKKNKCFVCAQIGARRGYAVPLILEKSRMLGRFYTDLAGNVGWGKLVSKAQNLPFVGGKLRQLSGRNIPDEIIEKTKTFMIPVVKHLFLSAFRKSDASVKFRHEMSRAREIGLAAARRGFGDATHLYVMLDEMAPLISAAKQRGIKVVSEVYILLSAERILELEREKFPSWGAEPADFDSIRCEFGTKDLLSTSIDYYICPSTAVKRDLVENWGVNAHQAIVVPYGMHPRWLELSPTPEPGRILFVGTADLRKGIHYLAMANEILRARGRIYDFRVAGNAGECVRSQPMCSNLKFLGRVPRNLIHEEFQRADVFVLPSLAEGSAEVTYEAMAASVPLVVTESAGSVVRDGQEGVVVPERDAHRLADAIEYVVENRSVRDQFARAARERAKDYTWERYGERLVAALETTVAGSNE